MRGTRGKGKEETERSSVMRGRRPGTGWTDIEHDGHAARVLEHQRGVDAPAGFQRGMWLDEHQVEAARLQLDRGAGRQWQAIGEAAHAGDAIVVAHRVDLDALGCRALHVQQPVVDPGAVVQCQEAADHGRTGRRLAQPRRAHAHASARPGVVCGRRRRRLACRQRQQAGKGKFHSSVSIRVGGTGVSKSVSGDGAACVCASR